MPTYLRSVVLVVLGCVAFMGCGDNQAPGEARALWEQIHSPDYRTFPRAPGYETRKNAESPHSDKVDIYINDVMNDAILAGEAITEWPVGSLVVKDGWKDDGNLELVAVMEKREDGWFYAEYFDFDGEADYSGQPDVCTGCHKSGADYIRAFGFP